jgi:hypothetical protein
MSIFTFNAPAAKTVDGVLSAFRSTIADLQDVAIAHNDAAAEHDRVATAALSAKAAAETEATRATAIASQMQAIFG